MRDDQARAVAVDASGIYWISSADGIGQVSRADQSGQSIKVVASKVRDASGLVVDDKDLYWAAGKAIFRADKSQGKAQLFAVGQRDISGLVLDDATAYWIEGDYQIGYDIKSADKRRPVPRVLAAKEHDLGMDGLQVSNGSVFWLAKDQLRTVARGSAARNLLDANTDAFAASAETLAISSKNRLWFGSSASAPTAANVRGVWRPDYMLRIAGRYVYGSENGWNMKSSHPSRLWRVAIAGGCPELLANFSAQYFNGFAVFENRVYWADAKNGGIFRAETR